MEIAIMNLKKITAAFFAAFIMAAVPFSAYADDESDGEVLAEDGSAEKVTDDIIDSTGTYQYSIRDDGTASIEFYLKREESSVVIPEELDGIKVTKLGDYAYLEHEEIIDITISENLLDFGTVSFYGCTNLEEFKVNEKNPLYCIVDGGILYDQAGTCLMGYPAQLKNEEYVVPDGTIGINNSAFACNPYIKKVTVPEGVVSDYFGIRVFAECTALEDVKLPESLTAISEFCFAGCTSLKGIEFPSKLNSIGDAAFFSCTSFEEPTLPAYLTEIGQCAFASTNFTNVEIPPGVSNIGYSAFGYYTDDEQQNEDGGNLILNENFTVSGYSNSYAQSYCAENGITFIPLSEIAVHEDDTEDVNPIIKFSKRNWKKILIGVGSVVLIIAVIIVAVINKKAENLPDDDNEGDYDEPEADEEDNDEASSEDTAEEDGDKS